MTETAKPYSEDIDPEEVMQIQVSIRKPLQLLLKDTQLFKDTQYFFSRISSVIALADKGRFRLDTLNLLNANDTLLHASSEFLLVAYNELLKHDFRELFNLYRSTEPNAWQSYQNRKKEIYLQYAKNDAFGVANFHRITRKLGYEVDVLKPVEVDYED